LILRKFLRRPGGRRFRFFLTCGFEVTPARFERPRAKISRAGAWKLRLFPSQKNEEGAEPWRISRVMEL
jgi:hypothetical protein